MAGMRKSPFRYTNPNWINSFRFPNASGPVRAPISREIYLLLTTMLIVAGLPLWGAIYVIDNFMFAASHPPHYARAALILVRTAGPA
jgi:hypothetical protein